MMYARDGLSDGSLHLRFVQCLQIYSLVVPEVILKHSLFSDMSGNLPLGKSLHLGPEKGLCPLAFLVMQSLPY